MAAASLAALLRRSSVVAVAASVCATIFSIVAWVSLGGTVGSRDYFAGLRRRGMGPLPRGLAGDSAGRDA